MQELPWPRAAVAALPLAMIAGLFAWWGWESGAYFGVVFLPGAMLVLVLLGMLLLFAPWQARLAGPTAVALVTLLALAAWTLLSALWSPSPDTAVADAQRVVAYAALFVLGLWLCMLLGRHSIFALAPLAIAGGAVALGTLIALWAGSDSREFLEVDATLRFPLGYRNAVAAFFVIGILALVALAASREVHWQLRAVLVALATVSIELVILAQSRTSVFAVAVALVVLLAAYPERLRVGLWLAAAGIPAVLALPWLLDVYQQGGENTAESIPPLHSACRAIAVTALASLIGGLAMARFEPDLRLSQRARGLLTRATAGAGAAAVIAAVILLATAEGGPFGIVDRYIDDLTAGTPDLSSQGSRFGVDLRTERGDIWRVAIDEAVDHPANGVGAGGFRRSYLLDRDATGVQPEDPHSIELLMASELGIPGLLMFGVFVGGTLVGILRARRMGPTAAQLAGTTVAIAAYWFVHASVDWFWSYPAISGPATFAMGAAVAPALLVPGASGRTPVRTAVAVAAALAALSLTPFFFSERYTNHALRNWRADLPGAYSDLDRAADLNPLDTMPLVAEATIAESNGDSDRALAALAEAQGREPDQWEPYYLQARVLVRVDPAAATVALARADELNPGGPEINALAEELSQTAPPQARP